MIFLSLLKSTIISKGDSFGSIYTNILKIFKKKWAKIKKEAYTIIKMLKKLCLIVKKTKKLYYFNILRFLYIRGVYQNKFEFVYNF